MSVAPVAAPPLPRARLDSLIARVVGAPASRLDTLAGGASTRRYHRAWFDGRAPMLVMFAPDGAKPAEIEAVRTAAARWPFLEVRDLLAARGVRVPEVYGEDCDAGLLLLEDLGDVTLADALGRSPERRASLYRRAIRDLAAMHAALATVPSESVVAARAFDERLLRWELAHFVEFGLDARGVVRSPAAVRALDEAFDAIAHELGARPRGFVHRDYQSRNLMLDPRGGADVDALAVIDFQDALLGPRAYDLVALLRDSYQDLDEPFVAQMLDGYGDDRGFDGASRAALRDEFDRLTVQRKLKDAGRFVFIERHKGDASFLPYIGPSLARVRVGLERLAGDATFARVRALLADALPGHFG
jgi:aminoglycoside/choline kinase family phosphotransferase